MPPSSLQPGVRHTTDPASQTVQTWIGPLQQHARAEFETTASTEILTSGLPKQAGGIEAYSVDRSRIRHSRILETSLAFAFTR